MQCRWLLRRLREVIFLTSTRKSHFSTSLLDIWKLFLLRLREGWEVIVWTLLFNLDVWAHMVEFCCYNYILYMLYKWCNIIIWKYFFWWEKGLHRRFVSSTGGVDVSITNGSRYEPAVRGAHHQRFWNRRWWPRYHQRHKSNASRTVGDTPYEPAVMRGAGVVTATLGGRFTHAAVKTIAGYYLLGCLPMQSYLGSMWWVTWLVGIMCNLCRV